MGKTTIWSAVVEEAVGRGFGVLVARPSEAEAELAFSVLTDLFAPVEDATLAELPGVQRPLSSRRSRRGEERVGTRVDPVAVALAVARRAPASVHLRAGGGRGRRPPVGRRSQPARAHLRVSPARRRAAWGSSRPCALGFDLELTRLAERDGNSVDRIEIGGLGKRQLARLVFERTGRTLSPPQLQTARSALGWKPVLRARDRRDGRTSSDVPATPRGRASRPTRGSLGRRSRGPALTAATLGSHRSQRLDLHGAEVHELRAARIVDEQAREPLVRAIHCSRRPCWTCTRAEERRLVHALARGRARRSGRACAASRSWHGGAERSGRRRSSSARPLGWTHAARRRRRPRWRSAPRRSRPRTTRSEDATSAQGRRSVPGGG